MKTLFEVVFEDAELLVINKPAGLVCHPTKGDACSSLIGRVRLYFGPDRPAHLINRLDRETSGLVLVAKNAEVAGALGKIWERRAVQKTYFAIVHGHLSAQEQIIDARLGKDEQSLVAVKDCVRGDGVSAQTQVYLERLFARDGREFSLLRVIPSTGRKHQIRIHLQFIGHPIVGDKLYGGDEDCYLALVENRLTDVQRRKLISPYQALHAGELAFSWSGRSMKFHAEPEPWFQDFSATEPGPRQG